MWSGCGILEVGGIVLFGEGSGVGGIYRSCFRVILSGEGILGRGFSGSKVWIFFDDRDVENRLGMGVIVFVGYFWLWLGLIK